MTPVDLFLFALGGIALAETLQLAMSDQAGLPAAAAAAIPLLVAAAAAMLTAERISAAVIAVSVVREVMARLP